MDYFGSFWIIFLVIWQMLFAKTVFVNLSQCVWVIFCLNFKTFFWRYMLSLYIPLQILLSNIFPKEPSPRFVTFVAGLRIIWSHPRHSEQVCSIFSVLLFSFPKKFVQGPTWSCWWDVCHPYFWYLQWLWNCHLWLTVFTGLRLGKDGRYRFEVSWKHRKLTFIL